MAEPKRTSTPSRRAWGAGLLILCLLALVLGVFGAVYFERHLPPEPEVAANQPPPPAAAGPVAPAPVAEAPPVAAPRAENSPPPQALPSPESPAPEAATPPAAAPQTATAPPPDIGALARIAPTAAPANVAAAAPRYWVEFGAYDGALYANRLKQSLGSLGIAATVTPAPGAHGRRYLRVRTSADSDRAAALAQLAKAQASLHIAPLLHRVAAVSPAAGRIAATPPSGRHWVQFGAFRARSGADATLDHLRKNGIQATVIEIKYSTGKPLYLVRAAGLADGAQAKEIAQRGAAALHSRDVLIGVSLPVQGPAPGKALPQAPPPR